jgi:hypothetical protein
MPDHDYGQSGANSGSRQAFCPGSDFGADLARYLGSVQYSG